MTDKEKLEKALVHLKKFIDGDCVCDRDILADFPELEDSEDEKIRKALVKIVKSIGLKVFETEGVGKNDVLLYLERQKEQKPVEWSIQDAKKGDILSDGTIVLIVDRIGEYEGRPIIESWYFADDVEFHGFGPSEVDLWEIVGFRPATVAETNYLFKKMEEAGYKWNSEKKALEKNSRLAEWSEKDSEMKLKILKYLSTRCSVIEFEEVETWLNALPNRISLYLSWKPSRAQMSMLLAVINEPDNASSESCHLALVELYDELKKL